MSDVDLPPGWLERDVRKADARWKQWYGENAMTTDPTPAEAVDVERLEKVARAYAEAPEGFDDEQEIEYRCAFDPPNILALLSRLRAAEQRAERMLCEACGTVTRDAECDCTRLDLADRQRLVNYADAMANSAAELEAQNAVLRAAVEIARRDYVAAIDTATYILKTTSDYPTKVETQNRITGLRGKEHQMTAALATTPAEALAVVKIAHQSASLCLNFMLRDHSERLHQNDIKDIKFAIEAQDAARRLFGPARGSE